MNARERERDGDRERDAKREGRTKEEKERVTAKGIKPVKKKGIFSFFSILSNDNKKSKCSNDSDSPC